MATPNTEQPLEQAVAKVIVPKSPAQSAALSSTAPELCFSGRKFGLKSWTVCLKALAYGQKYGPNHPRKYPPARIFVCREERAAMEQTVIYTMRSEILGRELFDAMFKSSIDTMTLPNGSTITFEGLDKPKRIQGTRYGFAACDQAEQLDEEQFETLNAGCTQVGMPWTQTMTAFNPENQEHWAYQRYHPDEGDGLRLDDAGKPFAEVVRVGENDGLDLLDEGKRDRLDRLRGVWRERWRLGRWVGFTGSVYDLWDAKTHVIDPPAEWAKWEGLPPPLWPRWRGVDFGYNPDPYAVCWITLSPDGIWYLYRQEMRLKLTLDVQTNRVRWFENQERAYLKFAAKRQDIEARRRGERPFVWNEVRDHLGESGDPDDLAGLDYTGYSDHEAGARAMFQKAGIHSRRAIKDIHAGIETLRNLLDPDQLHADGHRGPRFFVVKGSLLQRDRRLEEAKRPTCFEEEVGRYVWKVAKTAGGARTMKDLPVDANNHMLDAVRYVLHTAGSRPQHFVSTGDEDDDREGLSA